MEIIGYFMPPWHSHTRINTPDHSASYRFNSAGSVTTYDIHSLGSVLHATDNGGLFLHISKKFHKMLIDEGLRRGNVSQDAAARIQEENIGPISRLCEYLSVLDQCRLEKEPNQSRKWYVIDHSRLYRKNDSGSCIPIVPDFGVGEHVLRGQQNVTHHASSFIDVNSVESIAKTFDELIGLASRNKEIDIISLIAQFHKGCCCYQRLDWQDSILHLFSIAEVLANECWRCHVIEAGDDAAIRAPLSEDTKRFACQWKNRATSGWHPQVAKLLEASLNTGQIDQGLHNQLKTARTIRNDWVHKQLRPSLEDLETALDGVTEFVEKILGVKLAIPTGFNTGILSVQADPRV